MVNAEQVGDRKSDHLEVDGAESSWQRAEGPAAHIHPWPGLHAEITVMSRSSHVELMHR